MGTLTARRHCPICKAERQVTRERPNHLLHFVLACATLGVWLVGWAIISSNRQKNWTCAECGTWTPESAENRAAPTADPSDAD